MSYSVFSYSLLSFLFCISYWSAIPFQVFHKRMPPEAIDLASRLLQYSPSLRCSAVSVCVLSQGHFYGECNFNLKPMNWNNGSPYLVSFHEYVEYRVFCFCESKFLRTCRFSLFMFSPLSREHLSLLYWILVCESSSWVPKKWVLSFILFNQYAFLLRKLYMW